MAESVAIKEQPRTDSVNEAYAGRRAECDGGRPVMGSRYATREEFTGTLTGEYVDHGDPPWRWYLMKDLTRKPDAYESDAVWCEENSLFFIDNS